MARPLLILYWQLKSASEIEWHNRIIEHGNGKLTLIPWRYEDTLGRHLASDTFESYSAGAETKPQINQDAVRLMKEIYNIDMEKTQYSKLIDDIPTVDIAITMGCNVVCPILPCMYREDWGIDDPTGMGDEEFKKVISLIENGIIELKNKLKTNVK